MRERDSGPTEESWVNATSRMEDLPTVWEEEEEEIPVGLVKEEEVVTGRREVMVEEEVARGRREVVEDLQEVQMRIRYAEMMSGVVGRGRAETLVVAGAGGCGAGGGGGGGPEDTEHIAAYRVDQHYSNLGEARSPGQLSKSSFLLYYGSIISG